MIIEAPKGLEVPEGAQPGTTFQALATLQIRKDGKLTILELDGAPLKGYEKQAAQADKKESSPERAEREMGEMQERDGTAPPRINHYNRY